MDSQPSKPVGVCSNQTRRTDETARWKQCRRAPLYEVSDQGRVRGENGLRKNSADGRGYAALSLSVGGAKKTIRVHLLVADAFLGPCPEGMEVNHIDGDKTNAAASNLEYISHAANQKHAFANGLQVAVKGERHGRSKLTEEKVRELRSSEERLTMRQRAKRMGVSLSAVSQAFNGKTWAHVAVSR